MISEYEQQRLDNIRRNQEMLLALNLVNEHGILEPKQQRKKRRKETNTNTNTITRKSRRLRGEQAELVIKAEAKVIETADRTDFLINAEDHFTPKVLEEAVRVNGHYTGWVEQGVMERMDICGNANDAWESEGGGAFSFKDPLGTGKKLGKRSVPSGQSVAKYVSSKLLKKNPNAYFYRHTEPGVEQWAGDWTEEERQTFLTVAKKYGCGDKWGLFSTHIPHRVGYQCSNYYRQCVIPEGWIVDGNYRIDNSGHAIYIGNHRRKGMKTR